MGWFGKTVLAVFGIGAVGVMLGDKQSQSTGSANIMTSSVQQRIAPTPCADQKACDEANRKAYDPRRLAKPELVSFQWEKGGFGSIMVLKNVRVKNTRPVEVRDLKISCTVFGASGTRLQTLTMVLYDVVPSERSKTFREVNMGFVHSQASRAACEVDAT